MEDLDHPKVKPGAAQQAVDDLEWLGLDWDEGHGKGGSLGPYVQTERLAYYRNALDRLMEKDLVYPCTCSRKDVENAQSAPHPGEEGPRYDGSCRGRYANYAAAAAELPDGRLPAWRFVASPDAKTSFTDGLHGSQEACVRDDTGDFVIARHLDGAGYMLAVVVDDAAMNVTEVMRGDDLLETTHRQILLARALDLPTPEYVHVPLMVGPDGRRLAKRHGDTRIATYRDQGITPDAIVGYLAWTLGWVEEGQRVTPSDLIESYLLDTVPTNYYVVKSPETVGQ